MPFTITVLGCNSAIPAQGRHPSAQVVDIDNRRFLIDVGEGTQFRLAQFRKSPMKISAIFVSHLHGDHIFGLPGLLTTMNLLGREAPLQIYGPTELEEMIWNFLRFAGLDRLKYEVKFHGIETTTKICIYEDTHIRVYAFPLEHKITTFGYLFEEKILYSNLNREAIDYYQVPKLERASIVRGSDWVAPDGTRIPNSDLTLPGKSPKRYAYCSDTRYSLDIVPWVSGVDLLYHEATYLHEMSDKAYERFHSTALQAGEIAAAAGVKKLLLGHFSSKYKDLTPLEVEARKCFANTYAAVEGATYVL